MAVEDRRACGYRKVGGLYLVSAAPAAPCDRLPLALEVCPVCGEGLYVTRTPRRINALRLFGVHFDQAPPGYVCTCGQSCPVCCPDDGPHYVLGVGARHYTPEAFSFESRLMGVSKHVPAVPRELVLGVSWIYLTHCHAISIPLSKGEIEYRAGVFQAFRPQRVELLAWESECTEEFLACQAERNITVVRIPDSDTDHAPQGRKK